MHIDPFAVEIWMNDWETRCDMNLAETCVHSLTIEELLTLSGQNKADLSALLPMKMTYGDIRGSARLLAAISDLYTNRTPDQIITTHGTIGANMLVHKSMVSAGDHVITVVPTYQQHYSIPASIGANLETLKLRVEDDYLPNIDTLRSMIRPDTKLIAINNPNNPTGALMDRAMLEQIAQIARDVGAYILCDEVYRGIDQDGEGMTASITDVYERGISTASMSKAFSLAGLRLGWIAGPPEVIEAVSVHRDYDTISVGRLDDHFAALALENRDRVLARSKQITRSNLKLLEDWITNEPRLTWVKPRSGTTTLVAYDLPTTSRALCIDLLEKTGVMFTPGDCFDMEGTFRIGFANSPDDMRKGLALVSSYLLEAASALGKTAHPR